MNFNKLKSEIDKSNEKSVFRWFVITKNLYKIMICAALFAV